MKTSRAYSKFETAIAVKTKNVRKGANLEFIANYMFNKPGATSTEIRRALCKHNKKGYHRGMYTQYFSNCWTIPRCYRFPNRYWIRIPQGWILTLKGMSLVSET